MENLLIYILLLIMLIYVIFSVLDITRSRLLTKRDKTNYLFLVFIFPFGGSIIYYAFLKK